MMVMLSWSFALEKLYFYDQVLFWLISTKYDLYFTPKVEWNFITTRSGWVVCTLVYILEVRGSNLSHKLPILTGFLVVFLSTSREMLGWPLSSISFPIPYSFIILSFNTQSELLTVSSSELLINKRIFVTN